MVRKGIGFRVMNSLAICEDDSYMLEKLQKIAELYVKKRNLHTNIRVFLSGEDLMKEPFSYDILLLDLKLPGIDGIEVAKRFGGRSQIIFVTAYKEYALNAFDVGAVHYLVKPVTKEKLFLALDRATERIVRAEPRTIVLTGNGNLKKISIDHILCCEVYDHQVCIHTADGDYEYTGSLDSLEEKLDARFFRCHRSFLVNIQHIVRQEKGMAVVAGGHKVMVSRRRQQELMRRLLSFLKNEVV